jgi:hypothetical protein
LTTSRGIRYTNIMIDYIFRDPSRHLAAWLALFGGVVLVLLSIPLLGWKWATGTPGVLLGLGCVALGAADVLPRSYFGRAAAGCLRIAGILMFLLMVGFVVSAILP